MSTDMALAGSLLWRLLVDLSLVTACLFGAWVFYVVFLTLVLWVADMLGLENRWSQKEVEW